MMPRMMFDVLSCCVSRYLSTDRPYKARRVALLAPQAYCSFIEGYCPHMIDRWLHQRAATLVHAWHDKCSFTQGIQHDMKHTKA
jgi:hypothetical protein